MITQQWVLCSAYLFLAFYLILCINNATQAFLVVFQVRYYHSKDFIYFAKNSQKLTPEKAKKENPRGSDFRAYCHKLNHEMKKTRVQGSIAKKTRATNKSLSLPSSNCYWVAKKRIKLKFKYFRQNHMWNWSPNMCLDHHYLAAMLLLRCNEAESVARIFIKSLCTFWNSFR